MLEVVILVRNYLYKPDPNTPRQHKLYLPYYEFRLDL